MAFFKFVNSIEPQSGGLHRLKGEVYVNNDFYPFDIIVADYSAGMDDTAPHIETAVRNYVKRKYRLLI